MVKHGSKLTRLQAIANLNAETELADVAKQLAQVRHIESRIDELARARSKMLSVPTDPNVATAMLSQAERLRVARTRSLQELARLQTTTELAKRRAAQALGKKMALEKLIGKLE